MNADPHQRLEEQSSSQHPAKSGAVLSVLGYFEISGVSWLHLGGSGSEVSHAPVLLYSRVPRVRTDCSSRGRSYEGLSRHNFIRSWLYTTTAMDTICQQRHFLVWH